MSKLLAMTALVLVLAASPALAQVNDIELSDVQTTEAVQTVDDTQGAAQPVEEPVAAPVQEVAAPPPAPAPAPVPAPAPAPAPQPSPPPAASQPAYSGGSSSDSAKSETKTESVKIKELPKTGGEALPLLALGSGILLVGGGLLARRSFGKGH